MRNADRFSDSHAAPLKWNLHQPPATTDVVDRGHFDIDSLYCTMSNTRDRISRNQLHIRNHLAERKEKRVCENAERNDNERRLSIFSWDARKTRAFLRYIFLSGAIIFEQGGEKYRSGKGRNFWKDWSRTEGRERKFVFYRSIISVRVGVRYSLGMDGLHRVLRTGSRAWNGERNPWKRGRILKNTEGAQRGRPAISKRGSEHQLPDRIPDDRIFRGIRRPVLAVEKLSPSPPVVQGPGPELIEPDINPPFVYPREPSVFHIDQESR